MGLHLQLGHALLEGLVGLNRHLPQLRNLARAPLARVSRSLQLMLQSMSPARCCLLSLPEQQMAYYFFWYIPQRSAGLYPGKALLRMSELESVRPQTG